MTTLLAGRRPAPIVIPFDAERPVERVLPWLQSLWASDASLVLLALGPAREIGVPRSPNAALAAQRVAFHTRRVVEVVAGDDGADPVEAILRAAMEWRAGLIAIATAAGEEAGEPGDGLVDALVRRSPLPVMVVSPAASATGPRRLIVPLDGSARASQVLPVVEEIARRHGLVVHLMTVIDPDQVLPPALAGTVRPGGQRYAELLSGLQAEAQIVLARAAARLLSMRVPTTWDLRFGPAAACIAGVARGNDAIVMTTHGRGGGYAELGSVAAEVIRLSRVPVLALRADPLPELVVEVHEACEAIGARG
jgi:nucleotide-binding universal stress UspA family protein